MPKGIPNKRYTGEFKQMVVETMMREKLSYCEAARQFDISDHNRVSSWERIYLMEGPEGLYIERRGRGSKGRPKQFPKEVEEDLLNDIQIAFKQFSKHKKHIHRRSRWLSFRAITPCSSRDASNA